MFGKKSTFGGVNTQTELFWWDGSFWILDGSSKLWWFEWNGILSIPQVWRRLSPHEERITHASSLKTSTKKVTDCRLVGNLCCFSLKQHKFPTKRHKLFWLFSMHIWTLTCYIHICPCSPGCKNIRKVRKMQEWQLTPQQSRQTVETEVFGWDGINYWSDNNFFSLGWRKKFDPAGR